MAAPKQAKSVRGLNRRGVFIKWRWVKLFAIGFAALVLGLIIFLLLRETASEKGTRLLVDAFSKRRLIEARLSGGFNGGEFNTSEDLTGIGGSEILRAEPLIEQAVDETDPKSLLAYGRFLMLTGKGAAALKPLRKAVTAMPKRAEPHNDLGALLFHQGKVEDALDEFNLALKCKTDMPEALFNRALCYERLLLRDAANKDYTRLLAIERNGTWVEETKARRQEVTTPITPLQKSTEITSAYDAALNSGDTAKADSIADRNIEAVVKYSSNECALAYLNAVIGGNWDEASKVLAKIRRIGRSLSEKNGDESITDFSNYLGSLSIDEAQVESGLFSEFAEAEKYLGTPRAALAQPIFLRLSKQFAARKNYLFQYYCEGRCYNHEYKAGLYSASLRRLEKTLALAEEHHWPYRKALVFNQFAIVHSRLGENSLAFKYCELSLREGRSMHYSEAKTLQYTANTYLNLRDFEKTLSFLRQSTELFISGFPTYSDLSSNYENMAECYSQLGRHDLALLYAGEALGFCAEKGMGKQLTRTTSFIALEHARLNQFTVALQEMQQAFDHLEEVEAVQHSSVEATLLRRRGAIEVMRNNLEQALEDYSKAVSILSNDEDKEPMINVLRERAEVYLLVKDYGRASEDLQNASSLIEKYGGKIVERPDRSSFLDAIHGVFDEMVLLNARAFGNRVEAFNISEKSRARTLLRDITTQQNSTEQSRTLEAANKNLDASSASRRVDPLPLSKIQPALPDDLRILSYTVTNQGTLIFLVTRSGFEWAESPLTTEQLDRLAQEFAAALRSKENIDELKEKARQLYRALVEPVEGRLGDGKRLTIIPDKALHYLPFAALVDRSNRYLIESFRISYTPSASVLVKCMEEARAKGGMSDEKIFAVGNPSFNRDLFPKLPPIDDAETEVNESVKFYEHYFRLVRKDATKQNVMASLTDCDVAHFSLHCLLEEKSPALVLAEKARGADGQGAEAPAQYSSLDDLLYLYEIYGISLPRTKLVILSACRSGLGQYYRGEGMVSLVRPFLALKIPTVVASLWSVDSQATAALMIDFHKERKKHNLQAGDALRAAQLKMAQGDSYGHPYYWAPFIAVGSDR
ncbi:MAG TPA: CHAT domain-containing protein [Blastocatellia bacterium]|nr:CHAT domain-containing protein [Blastocatellia bacterium]